jgi:lipoprotein-anchoring transpeptidase ErfK/SrfK
MPFSMFLTNDGIAIHGGRSVENGYASHGCIAIPTELAEKLFAIAKKGDKVIITKGKRIGVGDPIIS